MNTNPTISVLMPMYNAEAYLGLAIESILNQSYQDFELVILNDGSTDKSLEIALSYQDKRIRVLENEGNLGLIYTRNRLITEASGDLLAWLDSDDVAIATRLEEQYDFLQKNPKVALVASWATIIDSNGKPTGGFRKSYIKDEYLQALLLFVNYIVQSSVMIRKSFLPSIPYQLPFSEDYDLWVRVAAQYPIAILPSCLVNYRVHQTNTSSGEHAEAMHDNVKAIHQAQLIALGIQASEDELFFHHQLGFGNPEMVDLAFINRANEWLNRLKSQNKEATIYQRKALAFVLAHRWTKICTANPELGLKILKPYFKSEISKVTLQNMAILGQYILKNLFK
jgi:glycosyltransferase involved in cell wall biosynthesis